MKLKVLMSVVLGVALAGCWTVRETDYPQVAMTAIPKGKDLKVQVAGFDALVTSYVPVYGYETVVGPTRDYGYYGYRPFATTVATEAYIPQAAATTVFRDRATEALEKCGFTLRAPDPSHRVEVVFSGPFYRDGDSFRSFAWNLFTLFTADQARQEWTAKLRIYDLKTGKCLLMKDYAQEYDVLVWGPVPIFSPSGSAKPRYNTIQSWCLAALTDRATADASAFLSKLGR